MVELTPGLHVGILCFAGCENISSSVWLKDIELPDGLTVVGECWFSGSTAEHVWVPASVREIRPRAFSKSAVREIQFAEGSVLEAIGVGAF